MPSTSFIPETQLSRIEHFFREKGIVLDGTPISNADMGTADGDMAVEKIQLIYTEAANITGSATGVALFFGTFADPVRFGTVKSSMTANKGDRVNVPVIAGDAKLADGETMVVSVANPKRGAGIVTAEALMVKL